MSNRLSSEQIYRIIALNWMQRHLHYRIATKSWTYNGRPVTSAQVSRLIANRLDTNAARISACLEQVIDDEVNRAKDEVVEWCDVNDVLRRSDAELDKYLNLMERPSTDTLRKKANRLALKQWMWLVKRHIKHLPTEWHVAIVFWSRENGTGKSSNIKRLLTPIMAHTRTISVDDLTEKFSGTLLADTLVAFLDEFAGVEKVGENILKSILTGKPWDQRSIYSDSGFYAPNRTTAVASSNEEPPHGFEDHTGARRFWSIHCNGASMDSTPDRKAQLDKLDVDLIWAAVSSKDPSPHSQATEELRFYMDRVRETSLRSKTSLESFLEEATETCDLGFKLLMKEFQQAYRTYCNETKQTFIKGSYDKLGAKLEENGCVVVRHGNRRYIKGRCLSTLESQ